MLLPFAGLFLTTSCLLPQSPEPRAVPTGFEEGLDRLVTEHMATEHLPGVAVVVVREGQTVFSRGWGFADLDSERMVDPERTLFRIGSVSKAVTALAVARLVDQGRLSLSDDVARFVSGIENPSEFEEPVTVWNLLTHTGGFDQVGGPSRHVYDFERPLPERRALRPSLGEWLGDHNLRRVTPAGGMFRYDTYGISLAGHVLEQVTEQSFAEAMSQELFAPLGMERSFVGVPSERFEELAVGYGWLENGYHPAAYEVYASTPASSIDATPADMGRLLQALTGGGANSNGRLLSPEATQRVLAPQYRPHPRYAGITHGFFESTTLGRDESVAIHTIGHGGMNLGFWTRFEVFTESRIGFVVVTNRDPEAGGGRIGLGTELEGFLAEQLIGELPPRELPLAAADAEVDLGQYVGRYVGGVYCHSCTEEEYALGGWRHGAPREAVLDEGRLRVDGHLYVPTAEPDVLVREDGTSELFFGRDAEGRVTYYSSPEEPSVTERLAD